MLKCVLQCVSQRTWAAMSYGLLGAAACVAARVAARVEVCVAVCVAVCVGVDKIGATRRPTLQHTANTLQHTATHGKTLQNTATQ